jgi:hypothetical protein
MKKIIKFEDIPAHLLAKLKQEKERFIRWIHRDIKGVAMRKMALEQGAYYFTNQQYDLLITEYRERIECILENKKRLMENHQRHQSSQLIEFEKLSKTMMRLSRGNGRVLRMTKEMLLPATIEERRLELAYDEEKNEISQLRIQQIKRRHLLEALAVEDTEDRRVRGKFIAEVKKETDDSAAQKRIIDEYDRTIEELNPKRVIFDDH